VSPRNYLLHPVALHIWYYSDQKIGNQTTNSSYKPWHSILTSRPAIELAQGFAQFVRQRQPEQLDPWLEKAFKSQLSPFNRFAKRLREDYDAVKAGVTLPWSNGQTEGQINRLKMLKRQMYGRAGLDRCFPDDSC